MYKIKKPEELKKKKKLDYIHLYECFQDMEKKYTDILYKFDNIKKDNEKLKKENEKLNNKIIDLELVQDEISINVDNMRGKSINIIKNTVKSLKNLQKQLENNKYQEIIENMSFGPLDDLSFSREDKFKKTLDFPYKEQVSHEIIEEI